MGTEEKKGYKILLGTTSQWESSTAPIPDKGQICIGTTPDTDTTIGESVIKVGDGRSSFSNLKSTVQGDVSTNPDGNTIAQRLPDGSIRAVSTGEHWEELINRSYARNNFVNKKKSEDATVHAYAYTSTGDIDLKVTPDVVNSTIISRDTSGGAKVITPATSEGDTTDGQYIVNKEYAKATYVKKITSNSYLAYITGPNGQGSMPIYYSTAQPWSIVERDGSGRVRTADPKELGDAANKKYVDTVADKKFDKAGGAITGNVTISGNLTVSGDTTVVDAENLKVKDKLITVAKDNQDALPSPAGLHVPNYDGAGHDGALVFDATGTAYVGDVTVDSTTGELTNWSSLQPIATRDVDESGNNTLKDGHLVQWNNAKTTLADSGKTVDDFVPRIKNTEQNWKCYVERGKLDGSSETSLLQATTGSFNGAIIIRDDKGSAKVKVPTANTSVDDIVNRGYVNDTFVAKKSGFSGTRAYIFTPSGDTQMLVTADLYNSSIIARGTDGGAKINTPAASESDTTSGKYIVNREYAEDNFVAKVSDAGVVYCNDGNGNQSKINYATTAASWTIARRDDKGCTSVGTPSLDEHATNKKYVDDNCVPKTSTKAILYGTNATDGGTKYFYWNEVATPWSIPTRDGKGHVRTAAPEGQNDATTKKYVDDKDIGTITSVIENGKLKISLTSADGKKVIQSDGIEIVTSEGGTVDDIVSNTSVKPVQNKVIKAYVDSFQTITILGADE